MWRQGRAAPTQEAVQRVRPSTGGLRRGFRIACLEAQDDWALTASPATQDEDTPLHCAASKGHAAVAEQLLAAKADVEAKDKVRGQGG